MGQLLDTLPERSIFREVDLPREIRPPRIEVELPPPLPPRPVMSRAAWLMAMAPFVSIVPNSIFIMNGMEPNHIVSLIVYLAALTAAYTWDVKLIKRAGLTVRGSPLGFAVMACIFVPLYMWSRAKVTKSSLTLFWASILAFIAGPALFVISNLSK
jgi:hypothetical protein